ncbi:uncharacterized protein MONBRDRAFT_28811 [Monosiga brevicollis MX1]|uniref:Sulfatase N-terminal domain-containing protein n=1 Tax=Monosiga brevicollis TaxID=81824 RepID=A9V9H9_MONBE|nr:uncharacterized protein MONBRDRAFT_28811 [Monosiga brevicollis MX1]EDQ85797.1 predicted protein [Monosiga brevicollis MX1]|eukprot:XP_001749276.1 hypothetical protein [Monosiga brevicollis MX1]
MTGRVPDRTRVFNFIDHFREPEVGANWTSFPQHFKNNGYLVLGAGKTYHVGFPPAFDTPQSWSESMPYVSPGQCDPASMISPYVTCPNATTGCEDKAAIVQQGTGNWCVYNESKLTLPLWDRLILNASLQHLDMAANQDQPFFVAAGFHRPHLPFAMPHTFWNMYPDAIDLPPPRFPNTTVGAPEVAWHTGLGDNTYALPTSADQTRHFRKAYYLHAPEAGFFHGRFILINSCGTVTNYERGTRVPMMIRAPWKPASVGQKTSALTMAVDMYRTVASLVNASEPEPGVQGQSLASVFDSPPSAGSGPNAYAFSQFAKRLDKNDRPFDVCTTWDNQTQLPVWEDVVGEELYPHLDDDGTDFDRFETENEINRPDLQPLRTSLAQALQSHFDADH